MADVAADASALVDLLLANDVGRAVRRRIAGQGLHAPSHVDAEILSALGRSHRAGDLSADEVETKLGALATAPIHRHPANELMLGAWARRHQLRLADALYVELAVSRGGQPVVPATVLAEVWRGGRRQHRLGQFIQGCEIEGFSEESARAAGVLLSAAPHGVVDASVVECTLRCESPCVTSNGRHLVDLAGARRLNIIDI